MSDKPAADYGRAAALRQGGDISAWDDEVDVIVVGLGGAGVCAAIEAARAGVEVLVLERAGGGGGTTAASDGMIYLGGGTPLQKACGFEDSPEEMFKYMMASCGPEPDEDRIRIYCENSVEHYHWLVEQGVPFKAEFYPERMLPPDDAGLTYSGNESVHPYKDLAVPAPRAHSAAREGMTGAFLMETLLAAAERAGVDMRVGARVETLVVDHGGRISGVVTKSPDGERVHHARRAVVLAAGGFINNRKMVDAHAPTLRKARFRASTEGDDGRGIRMGMGAGGAAVRMHMASVTLPFYPPKSLMRGVFVNEHGQRFMAEDRYQGTAGEICLHGQGGRVFLILDDATFERPVFAGGEVAAACETVEELESELGFAKGVLQATLATYNEGAARGEDPLFHKTPELLTPLVNPPFGALDLSWDKAIYAAFTLGGLATNTNAQVLDADGEPVPGLYAAGRTAASIASPGYSSGMSIGEATLFGRIAGRNAAADHR